MQRAWMWRGAVIAGVAGSLAGAPGCALLRRGDTESPAERTARVETDARIRSAVEARLAAEPSIESARVRVVVERADVHLYGSVTGFGALQCAIRTASMVPGVSLVVDFLVLEPGPREVTCLARRAPTVPAGV